MTTGVSVPPLSRLPATSSTGATTGLNVIIAAWKEALRVRRESDALAILADVYHHHRPRMVELIHTGACAFACRHCIYPVDYAQHNRAGDAEALGRALTTVGADWCVDRYFHAGRSVTGAGADLLVRLRQAMPEARIGLVDNGISIRPHRDRIVEADLDWIDISLDGMREDHDRQRGRAGSFDDAVGGLSRIVEQRWARRVSVLSCLTVLNAGSIPGMIVQMNRLGVKNFTVSPVAVVPGVRPDPALALSPAALRAFIETLPDLLSKLDGANVEVALYRAEHFAAVVAGMDDALDRFELAEDHLLRRGAAGENEYCIRYFPTSLAGVVDLIVNADGAVTAPLSVAWGRIPPECTFGNVICEDTETIWGRIAGSRGQRWYAAELLRERECLRRSAIPAGHFGQHQWR